MTIQELIDKLKSFIKDIKVIGVNEAKLDNVEKTEISCMDFVSFDIAKKLKEKGFPQVKKGTLAMYNEEGEWHSLARNLDEFEYLFEDFDYHDCVCPTISQVLKWLRNEKDIYCLPFFEQGVDMWFYTICEPACGSEFPEFMSESEYDTYEKAAFAGIEYVIENLI